MALHATVTFVKPYADISYRKLEATDIKFADFLMQFNKETLTLSDVALILTGKNFDESITISEAQVFATSKGLSESLSLGETFLKEMTFIKSFTDAITLEDSFVGADVFSRTKNNVATLSDVIGLSSGKTLTDSTSISDVFANLVSKAIADDATLSDVMTMLVNQGLSDTVSFSDAEAFAHSKVLADSFTLDDATLVDKDYTGNKGNVFSVTDQISISRTHGKALGNMTLNSLTLN